MVESWTGPGPRDGVISYFKTTDVIVGESSTSIPQVNKILCTYSIGQNVEIDRIESTFDYNTQATTSESVRFYWLAADPRYGFYAGYRITYNSATNQTLYELVVNGTVVNSLTIDEPAEPNAEGGSDYLATYQVAYVLYKYTIAWIDFPDKLLYYPPRPALFSEFTRGPSTPYVTRTTRLGHATFATDGESWGEDEPKTFCNLHLPAFTPSGINNAQQQWIAYFGSSPAFSSIDIEDEVASYIISSGEPRFCKMGLV
jgi:hypothetical protein